MPVGKAKSGYTALLCHDQFRSKASDRYVENFPSALDESGEGLQKSASTNPLASTDGDSYLSRFLTK